MNEKKSYVPLYALCCILFILVFVECYTSFKYQTDHQMIIPDEVLYCDDSVYYCYRDIDVDTWEDAEKYCESVGGHLATITSDRENCSIFAYLKYIGQETAYFGLTDKDYPDSWKWITREKSEYTNWHDKEPNHDYEHYACFWPGYEDKWNDGEFRPDEAIEKKAFICEWEEEALLYITKRSGKTVYVYYVTKEEKEKYNCISIITDKQNE